MVQSYFHVQPNFIVVKLGRVDVVVGVVTIKWVKEIVEVLKNTLHPASQVCSVCFPIVH